MCMNGKALRFLGIAGCGERRNDVLYGRASDGKGNEDLLVYFGGDIQDFTEVMETHRDNKNYTKWSLDNTVLSLQKSFPTCHILAVRPSKMEYKTFSCFENFVPSGNCGIPNHIPMHNSIKHLELLINNLQSQITLNYSKLILVGFSKGCVVLNQFLYEFNHLKEKSGFIEKIRDMYWLDGGHSGGKNTWVTNKSLLETLTQFKITVHIHVSPYQINDDRRPWIRKEEKQFYHTLNQLKASVHRKVHFSDAAASIEKHFMILHEFH